VWDLDVQIEKMREGTNLATRKEEALYRLDDFKQQTFERLEEAGRAQSEFSKGAKQQEREVTALLEGVQAHAERLSVDKREMETASERLRTVESRLGEGEQRMDTLASRESMLTDLSERTEQLSAREKQLTSQAEKRSDRR